MIAPAALKLRAFPAHTRAMELRRIKGPPLLLSAAQLHVKVVAAAAYGSRPANLAR